LLTYQTKKNTAAPAGAALVLNTTLQKRTTYFLSDGLGFNRASILGSPSFYTPVFLTGTTPKVLANKNRKHKPPALQ